jgi:hypothetical protein
MKWKNSGAVYEILSTRSRIPPWPGSSCPVSFSPKSRFTAEMVRSPAKPARLISIPASPASGQLNGVSHGAIRHRQSRGHANAAEEAFQGFPRADGGGDFPGPKPLADDVLRHIVELGQQDKIQR